MLHLCPTCRRQLAEPGFCPFDGTALIPGVITDLPTVVSGAMPAQVRGATPDERTVIGPESGEVPSTQLELRRQTFPLTPSPVPVVGTGEITQARRPRAEPDPAAGVRPPSDPPRIKVMSASDDPNAALELLRAPQDSEYDRLIGQTLDGRYYVENKIGEGGMGVVFSARHAVIERPLAIKVLKRDAMRDTATIRRFVQEAKAASRIGHPNIVDVTDFGTTPDGMTYSVMEFVPGQTLGSAIRAAAPFPPARAIRITAQIARALAAAHDKGIVHRDLKPENVFLLDRDGRPDFVKIVDFGIAKVTPPPGKTNEPRLTRAGSVFGTPEYMAPEQAAGRSDTDGRVDIYALGVLLYEMICGKVPHRGESMVRTLAMQMLDPIEPPSKVRPDLKIAPELEAVIMHALAKKREQRYQTMGELLDALDAILPAPVAQSVTGSPVYTLAPLPPGADSGLVPAMPAAPLEPGAAPQRVTPAHMTPQRVTPQHVTPQRVTPQQPLTTPGFEPARSSTPSGRRVKDEPEFTAAERPPSFEHVFTDEMRVPRERRWPLLFLFALIAGGAAGAFAVVVKTRRSVVAEIERDAGVIAPADAARPAPDAAVPEQVTPDAAPPAPEDAAVPPGPHHQRDAGRWSATPRDAAGTLPVTPNGRGTIMVQVLTRPEGANLYDGYHYRGPGGTELEEPLGTKMVITCRQIGYKPGTVEINFDGQTDVVVCPLKRIKRCIDGIKNPFDDCEEDPPPAPAP